MSLNKEAYIRYTTIDSCICNQRKPYPSMNDLIYACEEKLGKSFTISTIQKDIKAMKEDEALGFMAPIKFSKSQNGYFYTDKEYTIRTVPLNEEEVNALVAATDLLTTFAGERVSENFNAAVDKIFASVKETYGKASGKRTIVQTENPPKQRGFELFEIFFKAAKEKIPVCFLHFSYKKRLFNSIIFHPYLLKEFQNKWYVIGFSESHKSVRTFGIDRIMDPLILNKEFYLKRGFDPDKHFKDVYGVYPLSDKKIKIEFRVTDMLANYLESQPLHESQKVDYYHEDGYLSLSVELIPSLELLNQFYMLSEQLVITKPLWLREETIKRLKMAIRNEKYI
jgi:predicted DNA-binding transcriptional regulator YafY